MWGAGQYLYYYKRTGAGLWNRLRKRGGGGGGGESWCESVLFMIRF